MQNLTRALLFLLILTSGFLGADLLPFSPGRGPVEYTQTMTMNSSEKQGKLKKLMQLQAATKAEVNWVSQDEIHVTLRDLSYSLTGKVGKKTILKWKCNPGLKISSLKTADEDRQLAFDVFSPLEVSLEYLLGKKMVFKKDATGYYREKTGALRMCDSWLKQKLTAFGEIADLQSESHYHHFLDHILSFANKEIQLGKQQFAAVEESHPITYNVKRAADNSYFAYTRSAATGKKRAVKFAMKNRGKIAWNAENALLQTGKQVVTIRAKKKGTSNKTKIVTSISSKALY